MEPKPTLTLVVLNDGPYGTEHSYNGLRLAGSLAKRDAEEVRVFLIGDAAACAIARAITGRGEPASFDGHGKCFIETGGGKAGFGVGDFYAEPQRRSLCTHHPAAGTWESSSSNRTGSDAVSEPSKRSTSLHGCQSCRTGRGTRYDDNRGSQMHVSIDDLLASARFGLARVEVGELNNEMAAGALVIDIRPLEQRQRGGSLTGALVIDRNVLEWRLAPSSQSRLVDLDREQRVILVCNEGYGSSLAAASLQELGLPLATDLVGGFQALIAQSHPMISTEHAS